VNLGCGVRRRFHSLIAFFFAESVFFHQIKSPLSGGSGTTYETGPWAVQPPHTMSQPSKRKLSDSSNLGVPQPQNGQALSLAVFGLFLSACETIPPPPQIVNVPVAVSCVRSVPVRPAVHTDPQLSALDDYKFTLAIFSDRRMLLDYSAELEAVLQACR